MNIFETQNRSDTALELGRPMNSAETENESFTFIYSLVNRVDDQYRDTPFPADTDKTVLRNIGPSIPPSSHQQWAVKLANDHPWKLLWIKYSVYCLEAVDLTFRASWYDVPIAGWSDLMGEGAFDINRPVGVNLNRYINVSFSIHGPHGRYLYGGDNVEAVRDTDKSPTPIRTLQGYEYGEGQMRFENLLPPQSMILLDIFNTHTVRTLKVCAMLYGLKVRV